MARFSMYSGELIDSSLSHLEDFDSRMGVVRLSHKVDNNPSKEVKIASFAGLRPNVGKYHIVFFVTYGKNEVNRCHCNPQIDN